MRIGRGGISVGARLGIGRGGGLALATSDDAPGFDPSAYPGLTLDMDPRTITVDDLMGDSILAWRSAEASAVEFAPSNLTHAPSYRAAGVALPGHPSVTCALASFSGVKGPTLGNFVSANGHTIYAVIAPTVYPAMTGPPYECGGLFGDTSGYLAFGVGDIGSAAYRVIHAEWDVTNHPVYAPMTLGVGAAFVASGFHSATQISARVNLEEDPIASCTAIPYLGSAAYVGLGYGEVHPLEGEIYRVLVYNEVHDAGMRDDIATALQGGYLP